MPVPDDAMLDMRVAALNRGDLETWAKHYSPNVRVSVEAVPGAGEFTDLESWVAWVESYREVWARETWGVVERARVGDDVLVTRWLTTARGRGSETPVERGWSSVEAFDDEGKCVAIAFYADHEEALRAAGVEG